VISKSIPAKPDRGDLPDDDWDESKETGAARKEDAELCFPERSGILGDWNLLILSKRRIAGKAQICDRMTMHSQ
jgi:hypothetical protein